MEHSILDTDLYSSLGFDFGSEMNSGYPNLGLSPIPCFGFGIGSGLSSNFESGSDFAPNFGLNFGSSLDFDSGFVPNQSFGSDSVPSRNFGLDLVPTLDLDLAVTSLNSVPNSDSGFDPIPG